MSKEEQKAKERWAAHEATAKELAKIEVQLKELNKNMSTLIEIFKRALNKL